MKLLTRQEELVLLAVFFLKENTTLKNIRKHIIEQTGKDWSISSVYVPLDRLDEAGYLRSHVGDPSPMKGGKAKKYYEITESGIDILKELRTMTNSMYNNIEGFAFEGNRK
ncbi:MAG: PadR family transcriptional regulator [bacterium]|nr:PadR family transcriptional regulator [bacterium]